MHLCPIPQCPPRVSLKLPALPYCHLRASFILLCYSWECITSRRPYRRIEHPCSVIISDFWTAWNIRCIVTLKQEAWPTWKPFLFLPIWFPYEQSSFLLDLNFVLLILFFMCFRSTRMEESIIYLLTLYELMSCKLKKYNPSSSQNSTSDISSAMPLMICFLYHSPILHRWWRFSWANYI